MDLKSQTILVTGAGGFVGPHVVRALTDGGARVTGLGVENPPTSVTLDHWHAADLRDADAMRQALRATRPAAVIHLAGQSSPARSFEYPVETFEINVRGTQHLLDAVRLEAPEARVVVIASGEVYGALPEGQRATEALPFRPVNPYGFSKATADALAESYHRVHGLDVIRARSFNHAGRGQDARFVLPSFSRQLAAIEKGTSDPVLKVGNLEVIRDFSDVRDIASGYAALLERAKPGEAYNLCKGSGAKLTDILQDLIALSKAQVTIEPDPARMRPSDIPWLVGDPTKTRTEIGWEASIPLDQTLAELLEEARSQA